MKVPVLAYLLTFSTYGSHLAGSERGSVDPRHCIPGSPLLAPDRGREAYWQSRLNEAPWVLDGERQLLTLQVILMVCAYRKWSAHAVHVRTNHVHVVAAGDAKPERMLSNFKAYTTRAFRAGTPEDRRRYWTYHGSTRYLWNQASLNAAIVYVLDGQGVKMTCYPGGLKSE